MQTTFQAAESHTHTPGSEHSRHYNELRDLVAHRWD